MCVVMWSDTFGEEPISVQINNPIARDTGHLPVATCNLETLLDVKGHLLTTFYLITTAKNVKITLKHPFPFQTVYNVYM